MSWSHAAIPGPHTRVVTETWSPLSDKTKTVTAPVFWAALTTHRACVDRGPCPGPASVRANAFLVSSLSVGGSFNYELMRKTWAWV